MKRLYLVVVSLFILAPLVGCSSTSTTEPANSALTSPKVGSVFTYEGVDQDENGAEVDSTRRTIEHRIVGVNVDQEGRKATQIVDQDDRALFLSYTAEGDVAVLDSGWAILPITSKGETQRLVQDSGQVANGYNGRITEFYTYLGEESRTEASEVFDAVKIKYTRRIEYPSTSVRNQVSFLYFAKKLGTVIRSDDLPFDVGSTKFNGRMLRLTSYVLK